MSWDKAQTFTFDANASDVCTHIMGAEDWEEDNCAVLNITDGNLAMRAYLSVAVTSHALYSIGFMCWMTYGEELDESFNTPWLIERAKVAEIVLTQESAGQCKADLYIETDQRRWGSDRTSLWRTGPLLIGMIWNDIVETWLARPQQGMAGHALSTDDPMPLLGGRATDTPPGRARDAWKENGRPVEPTKLQKLVEMGVINPKTNEGAADVLEWAKEYQQVNGQQSLNVTRDIELWAGDNYQTLKRRADKWKARDG